MMLWKVISKTRVNWYPSEAKHLFLMRTDVVITPIPAPFRASDNPGFIWFSEFLCITDRLLCYDQSRAAWLRVERSAIASAIYVHVCTQAFVYLGTGASCFVLQYARRKRPRRRKYTSYKEYKELAKQKPSEKNESKEANRSMFLRVDVLLDWPWEGPTRALREGRATLS